MAEYRLPEQKYSEAEYLFQTIEMAKSKEEYDVELCSIHNLPPTSEEQYSWKFVKNRRAQLRRCRLSNGSPPAPPSTPTSLTASGTPTPSPTASSNATADDDRERINSLLYILDYAPKRKKKLKEQQRTDAELAELFNVVTITGGSKTCVNGHDNGTQLKSLPEHGVNAASRVIRRYKFSSKIFKIHRNPKEFFRERGEEDSVSAPEYDDAEEENIEYRRLARHKKRHFQMTKRQRRFARFEHQERMDAMVDTFDTAMSFNDDADA